MNETRTTLSKLSGLKKIRFFAVAILIILLVYTLLHTLHIKLNTTPSMPIGFYQRISAKQIKSGDLVSVCLPRNIAIEALQRGYLRAGRCPSGVIPILKQVVAVPGDTVKLTNQNIIVNGRIYWAPYQSFDHNGTLTKKFIRNTFYKPTHTYWLYGINDPLRSWDSRYYGGVTRTNIIGIYKPLLTL